MRKHKTQRHLHTDKYLYALAAAAEQHNIVTVHTYDKLQILEVALCIISVEISRIT